MERSLEKYSNMPVSKAVIQNALPAVAAMLMVLIYNLADTFFIGQTHDAFQVAAVSLATPVFLVFMSIGTIFGVGGTSVISRAFGEGRKDYAGKVSAFCMWSCVVIGVMITMGFLIFMDPMLRLIGASEDTWDYTKAYLIIVSFSGTFALISSCFSNILRAEGQATKAMNGQLIGNILNMALDAVFIMVFHWDIVGCALATLFGEIVGAVYYLFYYLTGKSSLSVNIRDVTLKNRVAGSVLSIGIPAALGSILMSVSQIIMNSQMAEYGDMALAGVGVAMKITMITGMVSMGIGQGVQPLLGYCVGAGIWGRFKKYMKFALSFATILGVLLTLLCYLFTNQIVSAFLTDVSASEYAVEFARILLSTGPLFGIFYVLTNALQAMGAALPSLVINVSRQGLIYIPMLFLLNAVLGRDGLMWAQPVVDVVSLALGIVMYIFVSRKMIRDR
ncbi:MAG: MATE family efflux transporter [Lachnospiraceae bacterium]